MDLFDQLADVSARQAILGAEQTMKVMYREKLIGHLLARFTTGNLEEIAKEVELKDIPKEQMFEFLQSCIRLSGKSPKT